MSNSDREFEECNKTMSEKQNDIDLLQTQSWCPTCGQNERATERCEELENTGMIGSSPAQFIAKIQTLEAKVKELEDYIQKNINIDLQNGKTRELQELLEYKDDKTHPLGAKVKELEKENNNLKFNIIEYMKKENLKLEAKLEVLTKCIFSNPKNQCDKEKIDICMGCKNKKLLEGVKSEM